MKFKKYITIKSPRRIHDVVKKDTIQKQTLEESLIKARKISENNQGEVSHKNPDIRYCWRGPFPPR